VVSLNRIEALRGLRFDPAQGLSIGATVRLAEVLESTAVQQHYPALADAVSQTATVPIRNMGTVAGNLCNASPCADTAPILVARGAQLAVASRAGSRSIHLGGFFRSPGVTALAPDELVVRIDVPPPQASTGFSYRNLSARSRVDMSAVGVAAMVTREGERCRAVRLVLGAVGPVPLRAHAAEALLAGQAPSADLLREAGDAAAREARPISDVRASAAYRRRVVAVLARRALLEAWQRAGSPALEDAR